MTWTYVQKSGHLYGPNCKLVGTGYSGHGAGLNNPAEQTVHAVGPLPVGLYTIEPPRDPPDHLGPLAMHLAPDAGNTMFGRSAFFIHGDNRELNHTASDGCIVLAHGFRQMVNDSFVKRLRVVATDADVISGCVVAGSISDLLNGPANHKSATDAEVKGTP